MSDRLIRVASPAVVEAIAREHKVSHTIGKYAASVTILRHLGHSNVPWTVCYFWTAA